VGAGRAGALDVPTQIMSLPPYKGSIMPMCANLASHYPSYALGESEREWAALGCPVMGLDRFADETRDAPPAARHIKVRARSAALVAGIAPY
jgi:hypothetical protein